MKITFPSLELEEMPATCSLDVADEGGATLEQVALLLNVTRERVRQILAAVRARVGAELAERGIDADSAAEGPGDWDATAPW